MSELVRRFRFLIVSSLIVGSFIASFGVVSALGGASTVTICTTKSGELRYAKDGVCKTPKEIALVLGETGPAGAAGAAGAIGPAGPSGAGGSFGISGGTVGLRGCDSNVDVNVSRSFSGTAFNIDSLDFSAIEEGCLAQNLYVYFSLSAATKTAGTYGDATQIRCAKVVTGTSLKIDNSTPCYKNSAGSLSTYATAVANFNQAYLNNSDASIGIEITTLG
jgi:hypothetical protein